VRDITKPAPAATIGGISKADIDESLRELDEAPAPTKKRRGFRLAGPRSIKRIVKWLIILIVIGGVTVGGWLGYKAFSNVDSVFKGGIFGLTQKQPLKQDENGRSNVLIFGTSEDDPDHNAAGGGAGPLLTD